ncbi:MAG: DUF3147 family protein [Verrucomicrobiales bacterium]|nr:DUF3147 family protein [Verrucomicrobiales bacterium]
MLTVIKLLVSAGLIYLVNEIVVVRAKPLLGSMIASLPLVSIITFIWIWTGLKDRPAEQAERLAAHSTGVFWFVLPSLPMFLLFPFLLKKGLSFWPNLVICCLVTAGLYAVMAVGLKKAGIEI